MALLNGSGGEAGWIDRGTVYSVNILSGSSLDEDKCDLQSSVRPAGKSVGISSFLVKESRFCCFYFLFFVFIIPDNLNKFARNIMLP